MYFDKRSITTLAVIRVGDYKLLKLHDYLRDNSNVTTEEWQVRNTNLIYYTIEFSMPVYFLGGEPETLLGTRAMLRQQEGGSRKDGACCNP